MKDEKLFKKKLIFIVLLLFPSKSFSLIEVDITRGNLSPLPIAVSPLFSDKESKSELEKDTKIEDLGLEISKIVENNLKKTGLFNPLEKKSFYKNLILHILSRGLKIGRLIKSQALITGQVSYENKKLRVEFRLWDVLAAREMLALAFTTVPNNWRRVGHIITDKVYEG